MDSRVNNISSDAFDSNSNEIRDKNFLFSDSRLMNKNVWILYGFQIPKLFAFRVMCIFLAALSCLLLILLSTISTRAPSNSSWSANPFPTNYEHLTSDQCSSPSCVRAASQMISYMNFSTNPCEDFYNYACGRFGEVHPRGIHISYGVSNMLKEFNRNRLEQLLTRTQFHDDKSALSKARTFYKTCLQDQFVRKKRSHYVRNIYELLNTFGGLDLFGTWNDTNWNFQHVFRMTREIHRVRLFFVVIWFQKLERIIIRLPKLSIPTDFVHPTLSVGNESLNSFKYVMRSILLNIEQDGADLIKKENRTCNNSCVDEIINDVVDIEQSIQKISPALLEFLPTNTNNIRFSNLSLLTDQIKWRELMDALFGNDSISDNVSVNIPSQKYMTGINELIANTPTKKMHHYIAWATIVQYLKAMGPKYAVLGEELMFEKDESEPKSRKDMCFELLNTYMGRIVRSMFIIEHIGETHTKYIKKFVKETFDTLSDSFSWMTTSTRNMSLAVLRNISIMYGHSSWVTYEQNVDEYYKELSLNTDDFFHNLAATFKYQSIEYKMKNSIADDEENNAIWIKSDPDTIRITYSPLFQAMNIPYGALQLPWYSHENPKHINIAAIGSIIYGVLAQPFLIQHRTFRTPDWWDETTTQRYATYRNCIQEAFNKYVTKIPHGFKLSQGQNKMMFVRPEVKLDPKKSIEYLQEEHFAYSMARELYDKSMSSSESHARLLPGLKHTSVEQTYYLAYAQSRCQNNQPYLEVLLNTAFQKFPHDKMINNFVYNDPKFLNAFRCSSAPEVHSSKQCRLF